MSSGSANASSAAGGGFSGYSNAMACGNLDSSSGSGTCEYGSCHDPASENRDAADAAVAAVATEPSTSATDAALALLEESVGPDPKIGSPSDDEEMDCDDAPVVDGAAPAVLVPQVTLVNKEDFLPVMELHVSLEGTLMQPVPIVRFVNLIEDMRYVVWISFVQECGEVDGDYMQPSSPKPGSYWNSRLVSFPQLTLYAANRFSRKRVSLVCNRKYFLQINYGIVNYVGHILADTVVGKRLVDTWFVPVNCNTFFSSGKKPSTGTLPPFKRAKH